ncbi:MAG: transcriptional regulator [Christensenellales bacterium]
MAIHGLVYCITGERRLKVPAQNICTNPPGCARYGEIEKAGLVDTKEGAVGGYQSARARNGDASEIAEALGSGLSVPLAQRRKDRPFCASGMAGVMDALYQELDTLCRQRLSHITGRWRIHLSGRAQQEPGENAPQGKTNRKQQKREKQKT